LRRGLQRTPVDSMVGKGLVVTAIVQARMASTRLPGKVLRVLGDMTVLGHVVRRLCACPSLTQVVVATTREKVDDAVCREAASVGALVTRGSEGDVLGRYVQALDEHGGDIGVRITSDCPFIDPALIDRGIRRLLASDPPPDYLSNTLLRTYPRGYDFEVFLGEALRIAEREAVTPGEREHVTSFIYRRPDRFRLESFERPDPRASADWRVTLDTPEDWDVIRALFDRLAPESPLFGLDDLEGLVVRDPALLAANRQVRQKPH
jgi:spore coat polysaccharide biosynthesis protein SpsF